MAGKIVHFELPSQDTDRAKAFWSGVFDWEFGDPMGMEYWLTRTGDDQGGAIYKDEKRGLTIYFETDDIDATIARVREHGGVAADKVPIPSTGWFARCTDSEGNDFSAFQSDESVTA
jgi:predicted enzyme related to lactoylglutathione lyase